MFPTTRPEQADGAPLLDSVVISGLETGLDQLVVYADATSDGYSLTTARFEMIEDRNGAPENNLVLRYESETEVARDVATNLGASTLTWNDVAFVGETTPQLVAQ